jgi:hypothetical protein
MEFSTNTVSRGDYEPITVPITLVQQDLSLTGLVKTSINSAVAYNVIDPAVLR